MGNVIDKVQLMSNFYDFVFL